MKKLVIILGITFFNHAVHASTYYVSPTGNDANPGTIGSPFQTIEMLNTVLVAGDIAYIRGGTYRATSGNENIVFFQIQDLTGTAANPIKIWAYPGETPIFNLDNITPTYNSPCALAMSNCTYVHLKGFTIKNLKQSGVTGISKGFVLYNSPNCTIELFNVFNIGGSGVVIDHSNSCYFLNCDSHHCGDGLPGTTSEQWNGGDAYDCTGGDPSTDIVFEGCRAWICGDDGWDFFDWAGSKVTLKNCWSFWASIKPWGKNGTQPDEAGMTPPNPTLWENDSNWRTNTSTGEGFKLGGHGPAGPLGAPTILKKYLQNCVSFENTGTGFTANMDAQYSHKMQLVNCIAFKNGNDGFSFGNGRSVGISMIFKNNWSWNNNKLNDGADWVYDGLPDNVSNNYWGTFDNGINYGNLNPVVSITPEDFLSTSSTGVSGVRQSDGSLPYLNFLRLVQGSDLIDKGVNVGLPYFGTAPDLAAYEFFASPTINAGRDTTIALPANSVAITPALTGTLYSYQWAKLSGGAATILSPTSANTTISNLAQGAYSFSLTGIGISGITVSDTINITVSLTNTWTGAVNTIWENSSNWSRGSVPDAGTDVIINSGTVAIGSNISIRSLLIKPGVVFTILH
jgi:Right handed beta helix region